MAEDQTVDLGNGFKLEYRDGNHSYWLHRPDRGKVRLVSVSTLAKVAYNDPSALMNHARNHALAGTDHRDALTFSQECGTAAHDQLEALARTGQPLDLSGQPDRVRGALQAVAKWYLDYEPTFLASEVIVCSIRHLFAGRFDVLAGVNGERVLTDLKSTDAGKDWDHFRRYKGAAAFSQLAGYAIGLRELHPTDPQPTQRAILRVGADGTYDFEYDKAPELSEASFLSKVQAYRDNAEWDKADKSVRKYETKGQLAA